MTPPRDGEHVLRRQRDADDRAARCALPLISAGSASPGLQRRAPRRSASLTTTSSARRGSGSRPAQVEPVERAARRPRAARRSGAPMTGSSTARAGRPSRRRRRGSRRRATPGSSASRARPAHRAPARASANTSAKRLRCSSRRAASRSDAAGAASDRDEAGDAARHHQRDRDHLAPHAATGRAAACGRAPSPAQLRSGALVRVARPRADDAAVGQRDHAVGHVGDRPRCA